MITITAKPRPKINHSPPLWNAMGTHARRWANRLAADVVSMRLMVVPFLKATVSGAMALVFIVALIYWFAVLEILIS